MNVCHVQLAQTNWNLVSWTVDCSNLWSQVLNKTGRDWSRIQATFIVIFTFQSCQDRVKTPREQPGQEEPFYRLGFNTFQSYTCWATWQCPCQSPCASPATIIKKIMPIRTLDRSCYSSLSRSSLTCSTCELLHGVTVSTSQPHTIWMTMYLSTSLGRSKF